MESPCPPSTMACTFSTDTLSSAATKARSRAASKAPAMPITRSRGNLLTLYATYVMTSSGFVTTNKIALGETATACCTTSFTILALVASNCSRLMPGLRGTPDVMMTTEEPVVAL